MTVGDQNGMDTTTTVTMATGAVRQAIREEDRTTTPTSEQ